MNVSKIHDYIVNAVAVTLPGMFVLTGCDTMIYLYRKSKKAILKRVLRQEVIDVKLLSDFREHTYLSETSEEKLKRFVHIFVYGMYRMVFSCEYCEILKNTYIEKHLRKDASDCQKICDKRYSAAPLRPTIYRHS